MCPVSHLAEDSAAQPFVSSALQPFLDSLLADQQRLDTPVARFSAAHDAQALSFAPQLIPLSKPGPGEQYAFEVELDSCTGCKSCVAACHSLNGLDENETWRDIGLLVSPARAHPFTQTVTTACHHCADPACLNGCPVLAYEKDPVTGIVRHLDDQCIGCSYCVLKCPYDVPKYSPRLGIVRKCDMCHGRLAEGEAPACAQACPTHAIKIVTVPVAASPNFLPAAPAPDYTQPTTRYISRRPLPGHLVAADAGAPRLQPAHWPLVFMLTLMPGAVGLQVASLFAPARELSIGALALGAAGLAASVFHLGQPLRAWRIFLGWRKSWLSREAMLFGVWFALTAAVLVFPSLVPVAATVGIVGLGCSAMIYVDTRRQFWRAAQTFPRFFGTGAVLALPFVAPYAAAAMLLFKLAWETRTTAEPGPPKRHQRGPLATAVTLRDVLGLASIAFLIAVPQLSPWAFFAPLFLGELAERYLFFRAVDAPKMPGLPVSLPLPAAA